MTTTTRGGRSKLYCWLALVLLFLYACGGETLSHDDADDHEATPVVSDDPPTLKAETDVRRSLGAPDAQIEFHGRLRDAPLWLRLYPRDETIGGRRLLALSYAPPDMKETGGVFLADHPELLVDDVLRIYRWNEGGGSISGLLYRGAEHGYHVAQERERTEGEQRLPYEQVIEVDSAAAWDLRLAPVLLAVIWQPQTSSPAIPVRDFFGPRSGERLSLQWQDDRVQIGDQQYRIDADAEGRLATLRDESGSIVLAVDGWSPPLEPDVARIRAQERERRLDAYLDRPSDADYVDLQDKLDTGRMEIIQLDE